ncbi:MAG: metallophosphatase family protein [Alistipes sp.]|jgi:putative phosphoesterase|nr:metallophosphatase family protein [Alistipes sp.]
MKRIGIISDTHGTFDEPLREFLSDVDEIWHAGDIGSLELADSIAALKPLRAVRGNIDGDATRREFPEYLYFECEGAKVLMTHIGGYAGPGRPRASEIIAVRRPDIFVFGHTHILKIFREQTHDTLCINPGAAGLRGIHTVRTAVRLTLDRGTIANVEVGEWPR